MLTDHKALESWYNEHLDTPSGPLGRRGRWHEVFSRFYLTVEYLPGEDNLLPDVLSRWAYPASQAFADLTKHGSVQDALDMQALIVEEEEDEKLCMFIPIEGAPLAQGGPEEIEGIFLGAPPTQGGPKRQTKIFL